MSGDFLKDLVTSGENGSSSIDSVTLSCAAGSISDPVTLPSSTTLANVVRSFQGIYFGLLSVFGCSLYILVLWLVIKSKNLRTFSFVFGLQVIILDLMLSVFLFTIIIVPNIIAGRWLFGEHIWALTGFVFVTTASERTLVMFVLVLDHFLIIYWPFSYPRYKVKCVICLSLTSWFLLVYFPCQIFWIAVNLLGCVLCRLHACGPCSCHL